MADKRRQPTRRTVRKAQQKHITQRRQDQQRLAERYEVSQLQPESEPQGVYRP